MCNFGSHYHFHLCNKKTHYFDDYILLEEICNLTFDYFAGLFVGNEGVGVVTRFRFLAKLGSKMLREEAEIGLGFMGCRGGNHGLVSRILLVDEYD